MLTQMATVQLPGAATVEVGTRIKDEGRDVGRITAARLVDAERGLWEITVELIEPAAKKIEPIRRWAASFGKVTLA